MPENKRSKMPRREAGHGTLEKHYRVTLDFRFLADAVTPEQCQECGFSTEQSVEAAEDEPSLQENIARQRRLYALLRSNRPALEQYLLCVLTQEAGDFAYQGLADAFDAKDEDELLVPLYKGMAAVDAHFFEECRALGVLGENTKLIAEAFRVEWTGAEVAEMNRKMAGDVKRAEVADQTRMRLMMKLNARR